MGARTSAALHRPGRRREWLALAAGLVASVALLVAGATVHQGLRSASDVAIVRTSGEATDAVMGEWERMRLASEPPAPVAGEVFRWQPSEPLLEPWVLHEPAPERSVLATLLAEAERRELVEQDLPGALELVLEALASGADSPRRAEARLRALQLARRLERTEVVRAQWAELAEAELAQSCGGIPCRLLAWLALPPELAAESPLAIPASELERLFAEQDVLELGPPEAPEARFELAPLLVLLASRLGIGAPSHERRAARALARRVGGLPAVEDDGRWHVLALDGRTFLARRNEHVTGGFVAPSALEEALVRRSGLPAGFALDFAGDDESLGVALRPRASLAGTPLGFSLRHADPARLGREESARLRVLRAALAVLALACATGGWLAARVLARERKLAELRSAFVAGVSHDLRTPLAAILLLAENLESGVADEAARGRYHRALRKEALRLRRLVEDVLDFSALERGRGVDLRTEDVELPSLVAELAADARARVEDEGRPFESAIETLPAAARLDARAVRRALDNLLDNALKHGRGRVRFACAQHSGELVLGVADEGAGVPAAERERAFTPFERLAANGHVGGTGLGLAIVRAIARGHGGDARIRADGDERCVFELVLPLEATDAKGTIEQP